VTTTLNGGESEIFMLEIKTTEEFRYEEIIGEEKRFVLDDIEGYYLYEENWYEPMEYKFMRLTWNGTNILWDYGYHIKGPIPSDDALKELSKAFDSSLYDCIKAGKYKRID
jgi:hypothetical protein